MRNCNLNRKPTKNQQHYINFIRENPGCKVADIAKDRYQSEYQASVWIYSSIKNMIKRGFIKYGKANDERYGSKDKGLYVNGQP